MARLATSVLQSLESCSKQAKPGNTGDVAGGADVLAAPEPAGKKKPRRRRRKVRTPVPEPAGEVLALADTDADTTAGAPLLGQSRRSLRSHTSASRSPKRSETAVVPNAAAEVTTPFSVGAAVVIRDLQPPRAGLNGKVGTVLKYSPSDVSYTVRVDHELVTIAGAHVAASIFQANAG